MARIDRFVEEDPGTYIKMSNEVAPNLPPLKGVPEHLSEISESLKEIKEGLTSRGQQDRQTKALESIAQSLSDYLPAAVALSR